MARRRSRKAAKLEPAVKNLFFDLDTAPSAATRYIDLGQCASIVNRRFYRAGLNWAVAGFSWVTQSPGTLLISKVPDTWVASNAWHKAFAHWNQMNREAMSSGESVRPKFYDFKVYLDADHHSAGVGANLIPRYNNGNDYKTGEWDMSSVTIPTSGDTGNATDFELVWVGSSYPGAAAGSGLDAVSLVEGYASSRALPAVPGDPNVPSDMSDVGPTGTPENWIGALDNEGTEQDKDVLENLLDENNQAPYPYENDGTYTDTQYPGGANQAPVAQEHDFALVTATTVGGNTKIPGTNFQGGLIRLDLEHEGSSLLVVHLVPGPHRGYLTQSQKDV